jgi:TatD DNase family protein
MILVDSHCHLYGKQFENDLQQVVDRAAQNKVLKIFLPAIDSETHDRLIAISNNAHFRIPDAEFNIYPMMGVHPCSINADFEKELSIAEAHLNSAQKFYAVGEIGLDYYWDVTFKEQQIMAFERQIGWAVERNLPIVIHSRQATPDCIASVRKFAGRVNGIFHCFSGAVDEAQQIIELGFLLGIGGVATYKNGGLKEILPAIGLQNLVLETDAPYLSPVPHRGKRNEPAYIQIIAETVAQVLNKSLEEVAEVTTENALRVFKVTP